MPLYDRAPALPTSEAERVIALEALQEYGVSGKFGPSDTRVFNTDTAKVLLIAAGYTELALGSLTLSTSHVLKRNEPGIEPTPNDKRAGASIYGPNRYDLPPGRYDAQWLVLSAGFSPDFQPDMPIGSDELQKHILSQLAERDKLREQARNQGITFFDRWSMEPKTGDIKLTVNILDRQQRFENGTYTLSEIEGWLNGDTTSVVLKDNHVEPVREKITGESLLREAREILTYLADQRTEAGDSIADQLFRIRLMSCPWPQLVEEFSQYPTPSV